VRDVRTVTDPRPPAGQEFEWRVFSDATCAGLTALIPIPGIDLLFEAYFRRRMPRVITRARGVELHPTVVFRLGQSNARLLSASGCVAVPVALTRSILKRIWRKLVYVLAIADTAEQLSVYWHRAFLIDHVVRRGHLLSPSEVGTALEAFVVALDQVDTSPLKGLARQVMSSVSGVFRLLLRARRTSSETATEGQESVFRADWARVERVLAPVATRYDQRFEDIARTNPGKPGTEGDVSSDC